MSRHPDLKNKHDPEFFRKKGKKYARYNCYTCAKQKEKPATRYHEDKPNFCSNECYQKTRVKKATIQHPCPECGEKFQTKKGLVQNREFHTCSNECRQKQLHKHNYKERKETKCVNCGKTLKRTQNQVKNHENSVCSDKCMSEWLSEHFKGENGPGYIHGNHGHRKYPSKFQNKREKIIQRDNEKCQICGLDRKKHKQLYTHDIEVHHIDNNEQNNKDQNLITLCTSCNIQIEHLDKRPKTMKQVKNTDITPKHA